MMLQIKELLYRHIQITMQYTVDSGKLVFDICTCLPVQWW